jgi:NAD(P)-dependent dehydrogenase (short-subunit alcohol dehydrogenase family)
MYASTLLARKRILISGGGTGIGRSLAEKFLQLGAHVIICGRRETVLDGTVAELQKKIEGASIEFVGCDISDPNQVDEVLKELWEDGPIDVLVNNAGANFIAQTHLLSPRAVDAVLRSSMIGPLYCTIAAGKRWIESGSKGVVLSILSTSTITGRPFTTPSAMAKSGLLAMTRSLAIEWGARGIRLVAIAPGYFPTEGSAARLNPASRQQARGGGLTLAASGRAGKHEELANLAAFLISESADYINGEMIVIDGGANLRGSGADDLLQWTDQQWASHRATIKGAKV